MVVKAKIKLRERNAPLLSLSPVVVGDEIFRLGGRIGRAKLILRAVASPILSGSHELSTKIVRAFHRVLKHVGTDYQLSFKRKHHWIAWVR